VAGTGVTYPAYATSLGRVLLAAQSDEAVARYLRTVKLERLTDATETDPGRLLDIVRKARSDGYAIVVDQLAYGVSSIAVPIMAGPGRPIAAVNSSGYSGRLSPELLIEARLAEVRRTAAQISETLLRYPALRHSLERDSGDGDTDRVVA
jgi:IclR family pca regulon transcriptional regulator